MRLATLAALAIALALAAMPARAGVIRGRVWMSRDAARAATRVETAPASASRPAPGSLPRPGTGRRPAPDEAPSLPARVMRQQRGVTEAVVYVDRIEARDDARLGRRGWFAPKPVLPRIVQQDRRLAPRVLAVPAGARVVVANLDRTYHNLFSVSAARRFDLGRYAPGRVDTLEFARPGTVTLHCDIHPDEVGYVVVVPNRAWARPDSTGAFTLPKLPPGRYRVKAWHPTRGPVARTVQLPRRGDVALDLTY